MTNAIRFELNQDAGIAPVLKLADNNQASCHTFFKIFAIILSGLISIVLGSFGESLRGSSNSHDRPTSTDQTNYYDPWNDVDYKVRNNRF